MHALGPMLVFFVLAALCYGVMWLVLRDRRS